MNNVQKKISRYITIIVVISALFYYPVKIAKYHLINLNYNEILGFEWRFDGCKKKADLDYQDQGECPCEPGLFGGGGNEEKDIRITNDGNFYYEDKLFGKATLKEKPSYFSGGEILTGGVLEVYHFKTGITCYYDSVTDDHSVSH